MPNNATNSLDPAAQPDAAVLVAITRMEAKVDVALAQHGADIKSQGRHLEDHEARLRLLEARPVSGEDHEARLRKLEAATGEDHEVRLRTLEAKPTVSPRVLWSTVASVGGLALATVPFLDRIIN